MLKIKSLKMQNFYGYKNETIDFSKYRKGIVLIKGKNGSGKSTIFEAIVWALSGKTIRKSTEVAMVNSDVGKNLLVEIRLHGDIVIRRGKKPGFLEFWVKGENLARDSVTATQAVIDDRLKLNYKVLMASMIFGQHSSLEFLNASAEDKRVIIRNFLGLEEIFELRDEIRDKKSAYLGKIRSADTLLKEYDSTINKAEEKLHQIELAKTESDFGRDVEDVSIQDIVDAEKKFSDLEGKISLREVRIASKEDSLERYTEVIDRGANISEETCGYCQQSYTKEITQDDVNLADNNACVMRSDVERIRLEISTLDGQLNEIYLPVSSSQIREFEAFKKLCAEETYWSEGLDSTVLKVGGVAATKAKLQLKYDVMKFWERAFSEQGMIKYVIRNILGYFNERCNFYLSFLMDGNFSIVFDEELHEKISSEGSVIQYISLSGGEKRKVGLAVLLALKSLLLLTNSEQSNLLFFDEIAENLDPEGMQGLYALLQELKKDRTVFIITHNKNMKTLLDSAKRLTVVKENGVSRIWRREIGKVKA